MKLDIIRVRVIPDNQTLTMILRERDKRRTERNNFFLGLGISMLICSAFWGAIIWKFCL